MIYFEPSDLGINPCIQNWLNSLPESFPKTAIDSIKELLDFTIEKGKQTNKQTNKTNKKKRTRKKKKRNRELKIKYKIIKYKRI
jgi:hypothetical protein